MTNPTLDPVDTGALRGQADVVAEHLRLLAHPERLIMLCKMMGREVTVGELVERVGLSQSAVSQHLARFRELGVVSVRRDAQSRYYRLVDEEMTEIIVALQEICERRVGQAG